MKLKEATSVSEQIAILKERGMSIPDEEKAREVLCDIGYYRLGFYWFPFEKGYPKLSKRRHCFIKGANFNDALALYYFDNDLRNILARFLHRIEICFRTTITYIVSNYYKQNPTWFADPKVVSHSFANDFPAIYREIRKNEPIKRHHKNHINDIYAPAWKTLEFMTFGSMLFLYQNLRNEGLRQKIAYRFGITNLDAFESQMKTLRILRNVCAHGHNLYDINFPQSIKVGELKGLDNNQRHNVSGGLIVMTSILRHISANRSDEFVKSINQLLSDAQFTSIKSIISNITLTPGKCRR